MFFDIETGRIGLNAVGPNGAIKRKNGTIVNIPSSEIEARIIEDFQKTKDRSKIDKFKKEYPALMDGDTVISGKETKIHIGINYNKGKDKPIDDYKYNVSKTIFMGPHSEVILKGFEKWDRLDTKTKERHYGELIKDVILKKGFFFISFSNTADSFITPVASISVNGGNGSGIFDVYENIIYSCPIKSTSITATGIEYTNSLTKKSFVAKASTFEEIIVTKEAIYRKGLTKMDNLFNYNIQIIMFLQTAISEGMPSLNPKETAKQMTSMGSTMEQNIAGLEMLKQMSPDDLTRLAKMGGANVTTETMEKIKGIPEMIKMMENKGMLKDLKKASAMAKGYMEGMGSENIERMTKMISKVEDHKKKTKLLAGNDKSIDEILEHPRKYDPLTKEFGAVRVG